MLQLGDETSTLASVARPLPPHPRRCRHRCVLQSRSMPPHHTLLPPAPLEQERDVRAEQGSRDSSIVVAYTWGFPSTRFVQVIGKLSNLCELQTLHPLTTGTCKCYTLSRSCFCAFSQSCQTEVVVAAFCSRFLVDCGCNSRWNLHRFKF